MHSFKHVAGIAALALVCGHAQSQSLIVNGSFEKPVVPVGGGTFFGLGSTFTKWHVVGEPGNVELVSGARVSNGYTFAAHSGAQYLRLTGSSHGRGGVAQTVQTVAGQAYTLQFWLGNVYDESNQFGFGASSSAEILVDGVEVLRATNFNNSVPVQTWKLFTVSFTATDNATTISFINEDPLTDFSNGLDAVSLVAAESATVD
jgi:hypothetical protein